MLDTEGGRMVADNITPEEKLLKIIENPQMEKNKAPLKIKEAATGIKAVGAWFKGLRIDKNTFKYINLRMVNKIVAVLCGFLTIFLTFDFIIGGNNLKKRLKQVATAEATPAVDEKKISIPVVNIADVLGQARERNIFTFLPSKIEPVVPTDVFLVIGNLKLVGIMWSDNPQAMIEDTKEQRTYLLSAGEQMGKIKIKQILKEKVILDIDGQEKELR
jgi:type II secretory pathway component PulC